MNYTFLNPKSEIIVISVPDGESITSACYHSRRQYIALSTSSQDYKNKLYIFDNLGNLKDSLDCLKVYDSIWNPLDDILYLSSGNYFFSYSLGQKKLNKTIQFSNIKYGPNNACISPNGKLIGLLKWRASEDRFYIVDLVNNTLTDQKLICCYYNWVDNDNIIYSTVSGKIGYYNIKEKKKYSSEFNLKSILSDKSHSLLEIQKSILELDKEKYSWIHFDDPMKIGEAFYFVINSGSLFGSAIIKYENRKFELLYKGMDKIINYDVDEYGKLRMHFAKVIDMKYSYYDLIESENGFIFPQTNFYLSKSSRLKQLMILNNNKKN